MNKLSASSKRNLETAHTLFQIIVPRVLARMDIGCTCGHRNRQMQNTCFANGTSSLLYPDSKHNSLPSMAVDLVIYHPKFSYLYGGRQQLNQIANYLSGTSRETAHTWIFMMYARLDMLMELEAEKEGYTLRWGGKWSNKDILLGNSHVDLFHWEILDEPISID